MRTVHFFATYYEQQDQAATLIQSLLCQTAQNWKLTICSNADNTLMMVEDIWGNDPRINFIIKDENSGHWGALNRKAFIENDLKDDELLVNCSVEDYYVPKTVEFINSRSEDFIYWDFSHHQFGYETISSMVQPRIRHIDWGSYALLGNIAKSVNMLPVKNNDGTESDAWISFFADGIFVEYLLDQTPHLTSVRIPKILFVKN